MADWKEGRDALRPEIVEALGGADVYWIKNQAKVLVALNLRERASRFRELLEGPNLVVESCIVLGSMKDDQAVPHLLRIVKYGPRYQSQVASWALGAMPARKAVPSLLDIWNQKRRAADSKGGISSLPFMLSALGRIGDARAVPALVEALDHIEEQVRYASAEALGRMKVRSAVRPLVGRLDDIIIFTLYDQNGMNYDVTTGGMPAIRTDATVRDAVLEALKMITGQSFQGTPGAQVTAWKKWWADHKDEYP